tara:strand:+ start:5587 stop:7518 length:1932 start_codon:yes stop_codon:yes gene_type:complete
MAIKPAQGRVTILDKATQPLRSIANAFKNLGASSIKTNTNLSKTQKAINGVGAAQNQLNRVSKNMQNHTRGIGSQAVGVVALGLAFKQALQPAIMFEQSMKDLESVAFGAADATVPVAKNMALLSKQAKALGASTVFSATEAASAQIFLAKAGFKTNQILSAMTPLLDLAAASGTDLGRASDITSDLLGAFGMKASETGKLADVLSAATSSANVDMETLFETLKVAAPIGIKAGQSMEGITTATALLGNVGIKGSNAGTALKRAFLNLASPVAEGAKVLKELGINVADSAGNMLPFQKIMMNLGKEAKSLSQVKRVQAFDAVFGKIGIAGALSLEKAVTSGDFAKMLENLQQSEGVASKMAKIRMDSIAGSLKQLASVAEGAAIAFGTYLVPAMRSIINVFTKLTSNIGHVIEAFPLASKIVGVFALAMISAKAIALGYTASLWLIAPALKGVSLALGLAKFAMIAYNVVMKFTIFGLIPKLIAGMGLSAGAVGLFGKALALMKIPLLAFNALMLANPIGLMIAGTAALVGLGVLLYTQYEKVATLFSNLWEIIKNFDFSNIMGNLGKIGDLFGFGGDTEVKKEQNNFLSTQSPEIQAQALAINNSNNGISNLTVNIADGKVKSIEKQGNLKFNTFLNNGEQN